MNSGALEGTTCIEISGHVAGPYAGMLLGDLGCEVTKVGTSNLAGSPINLSDTPPKFFRPAPLLGKHTEEVPAKLGYGEDAVKELRASGVI